ncbi:Short-chain dehydrogenase/reductase phqE [Fulvia fulva]|uniref:Short-chain dehydrogenase/reductase phqE n=1 Tax=Passalora fulva TaxID=5499 RepID=A0A9Q8P924_PASFU|nr:Short-chain dehydrogenase/reductase phqE [Fulvia fulva]KAK4624409.1 Short-chain dehydrogenase/reductase phqE [Fulvia fulva]KAK4625270.1 Short-chain dehydrogenase/reductase phqE [Fulvia fulva]UJO17835.1 Short-chain dehydrogenase/reductase phqE [Fulvia fulva]WPV15398.1 Short-chain dehydrogenase/reductase phqE [Fulvia fulva]WPV29793.1 Short-chain dehydrogenase/reductase phqE [Fulvia fulva]
MSDQTKYTQKLKGSKVLIIGGSAGIGYGVAEASLENGCTVFISSSNPDRVQTAVEKLKKSYPSASDRISGHACNLADEANLEQNIAQLFEKVGTGLDHVVHTAGDSLAVTPVGEISMESVKKAGMVRFFAPLFIGKIAPKYLNPGPASSIIITTGAVSERPIDNWTVVNSYATGLQGMTRGLALDLKPIRVNLVSPGAVNTELWGHMTAEQKEGMFKELSKKIPVGKVGSVEDVAESYLYLMKDRNVTGAMISTSGGHLLVG